MAEAESGSPETESKSLRDKEQWEAFCDLFGWICANCGITWETLLDMSPLRIKFLSRSIDKRRAFDKLSIFDGNAALINEKSLNQLNRELREANRT